MLGISEFTDTDFAGQVAYKPWVLSVSSKTLMPITAILISAANCVLLLHQLVIGPVTIHLMKWFLNARIILHTLHYMFHKLYRSISDGIRTGFAGLASRFSAHLFQIHSINSKFVVRLREICEKYLQDPCKKRRNSPKKIHKIVYSVSYFSKYRPFVTTHGCSARSNHLTIFFF